ncbi:unnamed protein product [marine sediment metagenome]|uniref:Uncharacterized protein n=1 Tax=marine sediment metagenome TaxID=412755 RepID=X1A9E7_9ZZZZ
MEITTKCEEHNRVLESDMGDGGVCYVELCPDCKRKEYEKGYKDGQSKDAVGRENYTQAERKIMQAGDRAGRNP